jgi:DNA replication protein DnaC
MTTTTQIPAGRGQLTVQAADATIDAACRTLGLPTVRAQAGDAIAQATRAQASYAAFLAELLLAECAERDQRATTRRLKAAGFPRPKHLADFDYDANGEVNPATIGELATCGWVRRGEPLCLIGDSGTGKSHLLIALGTLAAEKGFKVKYTLAAKMVNELAEAAGDKTLTRTIARYGRVDLLAIDLCRARDYADPRAGPVAGPLRTAGCETQPLPALSA